MTSGRVVLAATPIGNPGDASDRLRDVLATADIVAAAVPRCIVNRLIVARHFGKDRQAKATREQERNQVLHGANSGNRET